MKLTYSLMVSQHFTYDIVNWPVKREYPLTKQIVLSYNLFNVIYTHTYTVSDLVLVRPSGYCFNKTEMKSTARIRRVSSVFQILKCWTYKTIPFQRTHSPRGFQFLDKTGTIKIMQMTYCPLIKPALEPFQRAAISNACLRRVVIWEISYSR